jgi:hypothetical protein
MKRIGLFLTVALLAFLLLPTTAKAANDDNDDFLLRVRGNTNVAAGDTVGTVVTIDGDAVIDGHVTGTVVVVRGDATINGQVDDDVVVVRGTLNLTSTAQVDNVTLVRSDLNRDPAAVVTGDITKRSQFANFGWGTAIFSLVFWLGITIAVLVFGLLFAAVAGRQLTAAATRLSNQPGRSLLTAALTWILLPIAAVVVMLTIVGIPLGLAVLLSLPLLWLLGYAVSGSLLGRSIIGRAMSVERANHPYWPTVLGLIIFQVIGLVPFLGGLIVGLAGSIGAGALILLALRSRHEPSPQPIGQVAGPAPAA